MKSRSRSGVKPAVTTQECAGLHVHHVRTAFAFSWLEKPCADIIDSMSQQKAIKPTVKESCSSIDSRHFYQRVIYHTTSQ